MDLIDKSNANEIVFTGHSLGGATAQISFMRYINFCEKFPKHHASRYKDKCSYIIYATPIHTDKEIANHFKSYYDKMHSFDQYNDPIINIIRDAEKSIIINF